MLGTSDPMHKEDPQPCMAKVGVCTFMAPEQRLLSSGQVGVQGLQLLFQQWLLHWDQQLFHLSQHTHR